MINVELEQTLEINDSQTLKSPVCDYARYREFHLSDNGELVSKLNPEDKQEYYVLLRRNGLPKSEVVRAVERVERMERLEPTENGAEKPTANARAIGFGTVRAALQSFQDLVRIDSSPRQEVTVFQRKHS